MIEAVNNENLNEVLPLIRAYQEFYNVEKISDVHNAEFFSQFGPDSEHGCQFAFRSEGKIIGFATIYFCHTSTIAKKVAVMNDLYTLPGSRCQGVAKELIQHCLKFGLSKGAARLQWVTAQDNELAKKVYNSLGAKMSSWDLYTLA